MSRSKLAHTFKVIYEPESDGSAWNVSIPSVEGCFTYGRSLAEARRNIREALACCSDVFPDPDAAARDAVFDEDIRLPPELWTAVKLFEETRAKEEKLLTQLRELSATVARTISEKLSLRDTGELLGLSPEGVRKIVKQGGAASAKLRARTRKAG